MIAILNQYRNSRISEVQSRYPEFRNFLQDFFPEF